ncbi:MAG: hypothetical protein JO152_04780 [Mycobacteriaceae bacterium]|nr:hypothetical protein [Mycobacteriaceae bacterium]
MGATARAANGPVVRRLMSDASGVSAAAGSSAASSEPDDEPDDGELFKRIVDALEQRVLDELERRGFRNTSGVY